MTLRLTIPAVLALMCTACFATRTVRGEALITLKDQTDEAVVLPSTDGPDSRLGPGSLIRVRRKDGTLSRWFMARNLQSKGDGLSVTMKRVPITTKRSAAVSGLFAEHLLLLESLKPATGALEHRADGTHVLHPGDGSTGNWVTRFNDARRTAPATISPNEVWTFEARYDAATVAVKGADLDATLRDGVVMVDGLPWDQITALEVKNLDGFATWFTVVSSPVWVGGLLLTGALVGGFWTQGADATTDFIRLGQSPTREHSEEPLTDEEVRHGGVLNSGRYATFTPEGWRPLFSDGAIRKSEYRLLVWGGLGGELTTGQSSNLLLGVGLRVREVLEFGLGTNTWWADPFGLSPNLPGHPLVPGPSRYVPNLIVFLHGGADFDLEATRRVTLPVALQMGYGTGSVWQFRLHWGARVRIVQGIFVGLHPLNPQFTSAPVGGTSSWSFPSFLEAGSTF